MAVAGETSTRTAAGVVAAQNMTDVTPALAMVTELNKNVAQTQDTSREEVLCRQQLLLLLAYHPWLRWNLVVEVDVRGPHHIVKGRTPLMLSFCIYNMFAFRKKAMHDNGINTHIKVVWVFFACRTVRLIRLASNARFSTAAFLAESVRRVPNLFMASFLLQLYLRSQSLQRNA